MKSGIQTITPAKAAQWLGAHINRNNRLMRERTVEYLADEITRGKWQVTHQGIAFSDTGRLLDGQHRLAAIIKANQPVQMMVTTELDEDTFQVIDCGLKRANHERIHLVNDNSQNRQMCSAIRAFLCETMITCKVASVSQIEDEFLKNSDHWIWAVGVLHGKSPKLNRSTIVAAAAVYHLVKPAMAVEFMDGFISGEDLKAGCPMLKLRTIALAGTYQDNSYWRVQAVMRAHLHGEHSKRVFAASEDMLGNSNTSRVIKARSEKVKKAYITRRSRAVSA